MRNQYEKAFAELGAEFETLRPQDGDGRFVETGSGGTVNKPVQHDGEFVLTGEGSKDFGEITIETGLPPGKIRLRIGEHNNAKAIMGKSTLSVRIGFSNYRKMVMTMPVIWLKK